MDCLKTPLQTVAPKLQKLSPTSSLRYFEHYHLLRLLKLTVIYLEPWWGQVSCYESVAFTPLCKFIYQGAWMVYYIIPHCSFQRRMTIFEAIWWNFLLSFAGDPSIWTPRWKRIKFSAWRLCCCPPGTFPLFSRYSCCYSNRTGYNCCHYFKRLRASCIHPRNFQFILEFIA